MRPPCWPSPPRSSISASILRGFEDWFCDFVVDAKRLEVLFDAILDVTLAIARRQLQEVGREVDVVLTSDDLGSQSAFLVSREHYLKYLKPRQQRFFRQIKELTDAKVMFHSAVRWPRSSTILIEMGVDGLNPVQPQAAGMNPAALKKTYRGRMAFWGGTDAQGIVPRGSVADVQRMVERLIEDMGEGAATSSPTATTFNRMCPSRTFWRCSSTRGNTCRRTSGDAAARTPLACSTPWHVVAYLATGSDAGGGLRCSRPEQVPRRVR